MSSAFSNLKRKQKYNSLSDAIKLICKWHQFTIYDLRTTGSTDSYNKYFNMRMWLVEILNANKITPDMLPVVDQKNFVSIWFECKSMLNLDSLADMKHEFYELKWRYNGYTVIDLTLDK